MPDPINPIKFKAAKKLFMVEKPDGSVKQWGNDLPDNIAPKKRIKLSAVQNDDMDQDEALNLLNKSGIHAAVKSDIANAINSKGMVTPDYGDLLKALKKNKANANSR